VSSPAPPSTRSAVGMSLATFTDTPRGRRRRGRRHHARRQGRRGPRPPRPRASSSARAPVRARCAPRRAPRRHPRRGGPLRRREGDGTRHDERLEAEREPGLAPADERLDAEDDEDDRPEVQERARRDRREVAEVAREGQHAGRDEHERPHRPPLREAERAEVVRREDRADRDDRPAGHRPPPLGLGGVVGTRRWVRAFGSGCGRLTGRRRGVVRAEPLAAPPRPRVVDGRALAGERREDERRDADEQEQERGDDREDDEEDPDERRVDREVLGEPAADARDDPVLGAALEPSLVHPSFPFRAGTRCPRRP